MDADNLAKIFDVRDALSALGPLIDINTVYQTYDEWMQAAMPLLVRAIETRKAKSSVISMVIERYRTVRFPQDGYELWQQELEVDLMDLLGDLDLTSIDPADRALCKNLIGVFKLVCKEPHEISIENLYLLSSPYERSVFFKSVLYFPDMFESEYNWDWTHLLGPDDNIAFLYWAMYHHGTRDLLAQYWKNVMHQETPLDVQLAHAHLFNGEGPNRLALFRHLQEANAAFSRRCQRYFHPSYKAIGDLDQFRTLPPLLHVSLGCDTPIVEAIAKHYPTSRFGPYGCTLDFLRSPDWYSLLRRIEKIDRQLADTIQAWFREGISVREILLRLMH
jgi:hypothetical protein